MKNKIILFASLLVAGLTTTLGQVGIGTSLPDETAILELKSTEKGFLLPRLTTIQRDAIASPAEGLTIYNTTINCLEFWDDTEWINICDLISSGACVGLPKKGVTFTYNGEIVTYGVVESAERCWLDRNLGASQVATSSTDTEAYGDLFNWGRAVDGHQMRNSTTTTVLSTTDTPGHGNFIYNSTSPNDWRNPSNDNLWQGSNGINNPCPDGWRLPTVAEWTTEMSSWTSNYAAGAFASPLKLPLAGYRYFGNSTIYLGNGIYWSSTKHKTAPGSSLALQFTNSFNKADSSYPRSGGNSVRCIKD